MARERLGGADLWTVFGEGVAYGAKFGDVAHGCAGAVGVDVVDRPRGSLHSHAHTPFCALARRGNHICTIRCGTITGDFCKDIGSAVERMLKLLDDQATGAGAWGETVAVGVIGARCNRRSIIVLTGQRPHRIEHAGH